MAALLVAAAAAAVLRHIAAAKVKVMHERVRPVTHRSSGSVIGRPESHCNTHHGQVPMAIASQQ
jgi:hypothetical protein